MSTPCKYTEYNDAPGSAHNRVVEMVPEGSRVLEFGCATGFMSAVLKDRRGAIVTGIEIVPEAAELARQRADRVVVGDAETLDYDELFGAEKFDAIVFADVLEHLRDPGALMARIRPFLAEEGVVAASIPNVAHGSLRLALLAGEFRYRELGLLDNTHLRFFTRESIQDLFEAAGFVIRRWLRQRVDLDQSEISLPPLELPNDVREWLNADVDATTHQFVIEAFRSDAAGQLLAAREATNRRFEARLDTLEQTTREQSDHIGALRERTEFLSARERELQRLLREAHNRLLRRDEEVRELADKETRARDELTDRLAVAEREVAEANRVIQMMQSTRVWRIGSSYWRARTSTKRLLGRG